jgi:hypothetical protein
MTSSMHVNMHLHLCPSPYGYKVTVVGSDGDRIQVLELQEPGSLTTVNKD